MTQAAQQISQASAPNADADKFNDSWLATRLRTEQLKLLHSGSLHLFIIISLCLSISYIVLWRPDALSLIMIAGSLLGIGLLHTTIGHTYAFSQIETPKRQHMWLWLFNLANLIGSSTLIAAIVTWVPLESTFNLVVILTSLSILVFSCATLYACHIPAFLSFSLPIVLIASWWFWNQKMYVWVASGPILLLAMIYPLIYTQSLFHKAMSRRFLNHALSQKLTSENRQTITARKELEETRQNLERIVTARTHQLTRTNKRLNHEILQREETSHALRESEKQLREAMEASRLGLWDWNLSSDDIYHSRFQELFGYDLQQLDGFKGHLEHLIHPDDVADVRQAIIDHLGKRKEFYQVRYRIRHALGNWIWVEDKGQVVERNKQGRAVRMLGTRRDISLEMQHQQESQLAMTVFDNTSDAIFVLNPRFQFVTVNPAFRKLTGYSDDDVLGKSTLDLSPTDEIREHYQHMLDDLRCQGSLQREMMEQRKGGDSYPIWIQINEVRDNAGQLIRYVGLFRDLTHHKETEKRLSYLSNYDALTGLANRSFFQSRLHDAIEKATQEDSELVLMVIDLDRFHQINDSLGHDTGDALLQKVSQRLLRHTARAHTTSRPASDEFAIIIDNWTDPDALKELSSEIIKSLSTPYALNGHELLIGASLGISRFPENGREMQTLINQANIAMNYAKSLGGNTVQFYNDSMRSSSQDKLALETDLRRAIEHDELEVFYQPKMSLREGSVTTAEALLRWNHPYDGLIMPGKFIALAEETGLINEIGSFVLEQSCRQARQWLDKGWEVRVSVNISVCQMRQSNLADEVHQLLCDTGLPAHLLELEITESLLMDDIEQTIEMLTLIRNQGVTISIDDFGTGYSSLSYLKRLPVDTLKIDRSFISQIDTNDNDSAITRAIIAMAHSLDMKVVAEGVEKKSHIRFLREHACDEAQGYLISKPLPAREFGQFISQHMAATA